MLCTGFKERKVSDSSKCLVFRRRNPAALRFLGFEFYKLIHHVLPGARDLNVDDRLLMRFVFGVLFAGWRPAGGNTHLY